MALVPLPVEEVSGVKLILEKIEPVVLVDSFSVDGPSFFALMMDMPPNTGTGFELLADGAAELPPKEKGLGPVDDDPNRGFVDPNILLVVVVVAEEVSGVKLILVKIEPAVVLEDGAVKVGAAAVLKVGAAAVLLLFLVAAAAEVRTFPTGLANGAGACEELDCEFAAPKGNKEGVDVSKDDGAFAAWSFGLSDVPEEGTKLIFANTDPVDFASVGALDCDPKLALLLLEKFGPGAGGCEAVLVPLLLAAVVFKDDGVRLIPANTEDGVATTAAPVEENALFALVSPAFGADRFTVVVVAEGAVPSVVALLLVLSELPSVVEGVKRILPNMDDAVLEDCCWVEPNVNGFEDVVVEDAPNSGLLVVVCVEDAAGAAAPKEKVGKVG
jgi:hypothetical protein